LEKNVDVYKTWYEKAQDTAMKVGMRQQVYQRQEILRGHFSAKIFYTQIFLRQNFFTPNFFTPIIFYAKKTIFTAKSFFTPKNFFLKIVVKKFWRKKISA